MLWLLGEIWVWCLISFVLGGLVSALVFIGPAKRRMAAALLEERRRHTAPHRQPPQRQQRSEHPRQPAAHRAPEQEPPERIQQPRVALRYPQHDYDE
ncbi:hypothetical protein EV191_101569 [Tamaricihabitans halophyticus]|uniref:LapA family protein n=1 Tax=Tamaricihabitans halophyticus TaxID=1262583 RepID=A0A4R2R411_9PSEU|nr:hypothetical protein [Tamaricihabitans halophyticus]TCP56624.1 hypothetical protein EV191_101569 [Tamaricihabitans halophyticus]